MTKPSYGIGFYAPAGFTTDPSAIVRAVSRLEAEGHRVVVDPTVASRWQRFSAPDDERHAAIMRMANDPKVDIAIAKIEKLRTVVGRVTRIRLEELL